jgi:hypothetical protein
MLSAAWFLAGVSIYRWVNAFASHPAGHTNVLSVLLLAAHNSEGELVYRGFGNGSTDAALATYSTRTCALGRSLKGWR